MTDDEKPLRVVRPVPLTREFGLIGAIHSLGFALFLGFFALIALKLGADALNGGRGDANLPFALAWAATTFGVAFLALWSFHYWKLIAQRERTSYLIFPDRVEVRRDGRARPVDVIPLARTAGVQSWSGPILRADGLATLTLIVEEPAGPSGRSRHVFHPLPNVPDHEAAADLIRSLSGGDLTPA
ncbi:PH domain-containing protein [Paludisphaera rhizosphaerae]|uniref:PH domain-containing protein n=1 Tax=Paludisphaera rhizosphaerae TaxID=2711216 RepID=UPI0013EB10E8|nr:PH domain-containing protein [Paludisphaera rhizosphaerae]